VPFPAGFLSGERIEKDLSDVGLEVTRLWFNNGNQVSQFRNTTGAAEEREVTIKAPPGTTTYGGFSRYTGKSVEVSFEVLLY
jgi:hypothetical protein